MEVFLKYLVCITSIMLYSISCHSQTTVISRSGGQINCSDCNLTDKQGRKQGLWIENKGYTEVYYKNNLKDGIYKSYSRMNGTLYAFGEFKDGIQSGKWYFFNESGHLLYTEENISENTKYSRKQTDGSLYKPKFISYVKDFYPNGILKGEGPVVYDESVEIDYYKIGIWKYFDEKGNLVKTMEELWNIN